MSRRGDDWQLTSEHEYEYEYDPSTSLGAGDENDDDSFPHGPARFTVFNTHIDYVPWGSMRSGGVIRHRMEMIWDGSPQFLIGDFNSSSGMPLCRDLMRRGDADQEKTLHDAWLEAQQTSGPDRTFHGGAGEKRFPGRIDYIFYRPEFTVLQAATLTDHHGGFHPSDHYPVTADFE